MRMKRSGLLASWAVGLLLASLAASPTPLRAQQQPVVNSRAQVQVDFLKQVKDYLDLRNKLNGTLPNLSKDSNPTELDKHERALAALMATARKSAKLGDLFNPSIAAFIKTELEKLFSGPDRRKTLKSILDESGQREIKLSVNGRYPDDVPLSTMPTYVLEMLPTLPDKALEYRFISRRLILLDTASHLVVDYIENALPAVAVQKGAPL
jgi:hypothetical protein